MTKKSKALKDHKIIIKNNIKINTGTGGKNRKAKKQTNKHKKKLTAYQNPAYNPQGISYYSGGGGSIPLSSAGITQSVATPQIKGQSVTKTNKAEYDLQPYTKPTTSNQPAQLLLTNGPTNDAVVASSATTKPPKIKATRIKTIKTGTNLDHIKKQGLYEQYKKLGVPVRKNDTKNELNRKYQLFLSQQNKQKSPNTGPRVDEVTTDDDKPTTNKPFVHFENQQEPAENRLHQQTANNHLLNSTGFTPKRVDTPFKPAKLITDIDESPINENIQVRTIKQTPSRLFTTVDEEEEEPTKWDTADEPIDNGFVTVNSNDDEILPETPVTNDADPFETSGDEYFRQTPPNHNKQYSLRTSSIQSVGKFSNISPEEVVTKSKRGRKPGSTNKPKEPSQFTKKLALGLIERTNPVGRPKQSSEAQTASLLTEQKHNQIRHHKAGEGVSQFTAQTADNEPDSLFNNKQADY